MLTIFYVMTFLVVTLLVIGICNYAFAGKIIVQERLKRYSQEEEKQALIFAGKAEEKSMKESFLALMGLLGKGLSRKGAYMERLRKKLLYARWFIRVDEFVGLKLFFALALGMILFVIFGGIISAVLGFVLGFVLPDYILTIKSRSRMKKLTNQLPEALTIIANGLRAGLGFYQALSITSRDMEGPIKEEFDQVIYENSMGKPTEEVLINLGERTDSEDLDILISALLIQKQVGGSLAEILDSISHTIRERVRIKGEINTLTSQGKLSAVIICLLPIFIGVVIHMLNPEYTSLLITTEIGIIMLGVVSLMMVVGVLLARKIVDIQI